jgi:tRNA-2-methylthio-N6-dimethylallyladenosine synthase
MARMPARMPGFSLITFGCQMNQHDSERIGEVLREAGYVEASAPDSADIVVLNTCSVREKAEQKLRSEVGRVGLLKADNPDLVIAVAGCVAQEEGARLLKRLPQIDVLIGPDNIAELPSLLREVGHGGARQVRTEFDLEAPRFLSARPEARGVGATAFVTVMKGCNERCSFCIVPHTRGPERYRPAREIVAEIERLVSAGVREVTLLGQTVNSYRDPEASLSPAEGAGLHPFAETPRVRARDDESEFPALLRAIAERVPELRRLRYTSPHPRHLTWSLILAHRDLPVLARHVHLPVQSGSDRVLKRMIRRYSVAEYRERVARLQAEVPGTTLSTDVIVGFPGETAEDFAATVELVRDVGFTGLFGFKYSERPHTPAQKLDDDVPEAEKSARLEQLFAVSDAIRQRHLASLVGNAEDVLIEGRSKNGAFSGRTGRHEIVHLPLELDAVGEIVPVRITRAFKNSLEGEVDAAWLAAARTAPARERKRAYAERRALPVVE